jgi:hypothetical protein
MSVSAIVLAARFSRQSSITSPDCTSAVRSTGHLEINKIAFCAGLSGNRRQRHCENGGALQKSTTTELWHLRLMG